MSFAEIRHQERAVAALERLLAADRVPHAFIFCGPAGVGKAMAARALAQTLLCDVPNSERRGPRGPRAEAAQQSAKGSPRQAGPQRGSNIGACGKCPQCRLVERDSHPDLYWFSKPPERAEFPIAVVTRRDGSPDGPTINESVQLKPMQAACRVTVIEDAELMNEEAANAFLKTFEEAPGGAYLILVVTTLDRLLATIRSRGRIVRFGALPEEFVAELLEREHELGASEARLVARFAEGSMEQASALARSNFVKFRDEVMKVLPNLDLAQALKLADAIDAWAGEQADSEAQVELGESSGKRRQKAAAVERNTLRRLYLKRALAIFAGLFRDALLVAGGADDGRLLNADQAALVRQLAARLPAHRLELAVQRFHEYQTYVDRHAHIQLLLENACLELAELWKVSPAAGPRCG